MNSEKNFIKILGTGFVLFFTIALGMLFYRALHLQHVRNDNRRYIPQLSKITLHSAQNDLLNKIDKVIIQKKNSSFSLKKKPMSWILETPYQYFAQTPAVTSFLQNFIEIQVDGLISYNQKTQKQQRLTPPDIVFTLIYHDQTSDVIRVGKSQEGHTSLLINESPYIYLSQKFSPNLKELQPADFMERKAIVLPRDLSEVQFTLRNRPLLHLKKQEELWRNRRRKKVTQENYLKMIQEITGLTPPDKSDQTSSSNKFSDHFRWKLQFSTARNTSWIYYLTPDQNRQRCLITNNQNQHRTIIPCRTLEKALQRCRKLVSK